MLNRGICPESSVTQGEMGKIINTVVDSEYFYMEPEELDRYIKRIVMTGINIYTVVLGGTGILVISFGIKLYTRFCTKKRVKKEIIYVGAASTGKTELSSVLGHIHRVRRSFPYSPTRGTNEAESVIVKNPYGKKEELLSAIAKDISGDSDEALTGILSKGNFFGRNKIIILLLAHNKGNMEKDIDREYIDIQADKLKKVYLPDIRVFSKKIDRVVVFVNKCDTLPDIYKEDYEKAKEILYKEHFELLNENMPENVDLYVCFGSAKTGIGLDKLRDSLWQN
ncbi:MAG: hypothetical protein LUG24_05200 [Clostridiales bacterium]|nr:hypothetical protein [Clostridiales bacterium]